MPGASSQGLNPGAPNPGTPDLEGLDARREHLAALLSELRAAVPKGWRIANVRRAELDRFLFGPEDVVVAVGQDGLVANLAKYLNGQPVIGVNADPDRNAGVLVPHSAAAAAAMLPAAAAGTLRTEARTMIRAELDDGQMLLALNEIFVGHSSHQSARYSLHHAGRDEAQSSSGLIVASGTGATGWALSISRATGVAVDLAPEERAAVFLVREPWPSRATGASLTHGRLGESDVLLIASRMNEGGVVFADGIEGDRLDFAWGRTLKVSVARQHLRFVPGATAPPRPVPVAPARRAAPARTVPSPTPAPSRTPEVPAAARVPTPVQGPLRPAVRQWWLRLFLLLMAFLATLLLVRACADVVAPLPGPPVMPQPWDGGRSTPPSHPKAPA